MIKSLAEIAHGGVYPRDYQLCSSRPNFKFEPGDSAHVYIMLFAGGIDAGQRAPEALRPQPQVHSCGITAIKLKRWQLVRAAGAAYTHAAPAFSQSQFVRACCRADMSRQRTIARNRQQHSVMHAAAARIAAPIYCAQQNLSSCASSITNFDAASRCWALLNINLLRTDSNNACVTLVSSNVQLQVAARCSAHPAPQAAAACGPGNAKITSETKDTRLAEGLNL